MIKSVAYLSFLMILVFVIPLPLPLSIMWMLGCTPPPPYFIFLHAINIYCYPASMKLLTIPYRNYSLPQQKGQALCHSKKDNTYQPQMGGFEFQPHDSFSDDMQGCWCCHLYWLSFWSINCI